MTERGPGVNYTFNPLQYEPNQGAGGSHPVGRHQFAISDTECKQNKDKTGWYLEVEYTSPLGKAFDRFNMQNNNPDTVRIAHEQLAALCLAVGITQGVDMSNHAAILRGGRCMLEIGPQKGPEAAEKGYTEIKKRLDVNGNEPGKAAANPANNGFAAPGGFNPAPAQAPAQQPNRMPQQFAQPQQQQPAQQAPQGGGWPQQNAPAQQPMQQPNPAPQQPAPQQWAPQPNQGQPQQQQPAAQPPGWGAPNT